MTIHYRVQQCIHAAECVGRLPAVFRPKMRPWIAPEQGTHCRCRTMPSGALFYERHDGTSRNCSYHQSNCAHGEWPPPCARRHSLV
ncbi:MAG: (4Fe-4S)-binding protein [Chloroflexi bacterium]|nr:(4Fe-4S)-binding protein [Chloroflexota bacterium]